MAYTISGNYLASCSCVLVCGCAMDAQPRDAQGDEQCRGTAVFHIADGHLGDVDLSGVDFAFYNYFPSHLTAGDWKLGLVVDSDAGEEQADAVERILTGREGGPFGELSQFFGEYLGMRRAQISLTDGDKPALEIEGLSEIRYEPLTGPDGNPTTVKNAQFGFAPEFEIGRTEGHSDAFDLGFGPEYGERGEYTFSTEQTEGQPSGRI
ncbi:DUF1326 domain-containing protein [Actinomadura sp. 6N118]|uniref:DUF1326 domain-containing protein n=1 Tax=Actinomadura sp. 6N118 TaxID=3375151 RepID=UPI0037B826C1